MIEQEKAKRIEEHLPSVEAIIDECRAQGRELTRAAAEQIRERLRADLTAGHVDARHDALDDVLEGVAGGGGAPHNEWGLSPSICESEDHWMSGDVDEHLFLHL